MKWNVRQFNLFLALAALMAVCGCQTSGRNEPVSALRIHMQVTPMTATSQTVSVLRFDPVSVTIEKEPILTEANIVAARVINAQGGFALQIQFDENGTWILEQYSAGNPGKHFVIFGQWGDKLANGRWLAAPLITSRISDGVLAFTPDMSRTEADQLVLGLNNVAKKIRKGELKTSP